MQLTEDMVISSANGASKLLVVTFKPGNFIGVNNFIQTAEQSGKIDVPSALYDGLEEGEWPFGERTFVCHQRLYEDLALVRQFIRDVVPHLTFSELLTLDEAADRFIALSTSRRKTFTSR